MALSKVFFVLVVALLVASVTCVESAAAIQAVEGAAKPLIGSGFQFSRMLKNTGEDTGAGRNRRGRRKSSKKVVKKKKNVKKHTAKSAAANANNEGVLVNQQTTAKIKGDGNKVVGGTTYPIYNKNVDVGDIYYGR